MQEPNYQSALNDYSQLRIRASMQEVLARLTGKSNELLSFEEVAKKLKLTNRTERGVRDIPLQSIVGSVGRYGDFTREFLPLMSNRQEQERWARVKAAIDDLGGPGWPPIDVYQVGDVYFVLDGNHRVSVALLEGFTTIQARVIEVKIDVPLTSSDLQNPDGLIVKVEYLDFLEKTGIREIFQDLDLSVTVPGQYDRLLDHIEVHRYFMGLEFQREIPYPEALGHWVEQVYLAIVEPLRDRGLLRWFPGRTETDLYLWVSEHRMALESELGWQVSPEAAIYDLTLQANPRAESAVSATGQWRLSKITDRYVDRLFRDILVPLSGEVEGWQALEQALMVAQNEKATLHGLHVFSGRAEEDGQLVEEIRNHFDERCRAMGVPGNMLVEKGDVAEQICQRALLTDLVVLNIAHPPQPGLAGLGSGLRTIIHRSARPILTVPGRATQMSRAMVAFDGSSKSREAVFVAAYLAEQWKTDLMVTTLTEDSNSKIQDYARDYFSLHEIKADYNKVPGSHETFLEIIKEHELDLVIMGGYSGSRWQEVIIGSAVNYLLRSAECPLLICR